MALAQRNRLRRRRRRRWRLPAQRFLERGPFGFLRRAPLAARRAGAHCLAGVDDARHVPSLVVEDVHAIFRAEDYPRSLLDVAVDRVGGGLERVAERRGGGPAAVRVALLRMERPALALPKNPVEVF